MSDYWEGKMAGMLRTTNGYSNIHIRRDWTMQQITAYVDEYCGQMFLNGHWRQAGKPVALEIHEFGEVGNPKRSFRCDKHGAWTEVPAKRWSEIAVADYNQFIHDMVQQASRHE